MECLHPHCPMGHGAATWNDVVTSPEANVRAKDQAATLAILKRCGHPAKKPARTTASMLEALNKSAFKRLLEACPCLYAQLRTDASARGIVHLCEVTLGHQIVSSNVYSAFQIQHPKIKNPSFLHPPVKNSAGGGDIMEALCAEVLTNHGIPHMDLDKHGWPIWNSSRHLSLNRGKMHDLKLYGDILIPAAPHNILISIKTEAARERFAVSGNRLESVGFGFFDDASEFWTINRMNLLKRWGFTAIYMPTNTLNNIQLELKNRGTESFAININGRPLFRDLMDFGNDIAKVAGKISMNI